MLWEYVVAGETARDLVADAGHYMLGTRLKRLAERLQADAGEVVQRCGLDLQPPQVGVIAAVTREGPLNVGDIAATLGVSQPAVTRVVSALEAREILAVEPDPADGRSRIVRLTASGEAMAAKLRTHVWPRLASGVVDLLYGRADDLLGQLSRIETALAEKSLYDRAFESCDPASAPPVDIVGWDPAFAADFKRLNVEWVESMFRVEPGDLAVLDHPIETIIAPGGDILFARLNAETVGCCALKPDANGRSVELTKMAVAPNVRGLKIGEHILKSAIRRFEESGFEEMYLFSNSICGPAIHLYEKFGFVHDPEINRRFGGRYSRADVHMRYAG